MNKKKKERFGYYRVALCRGLGFRKITEDEFLNAYIASLSSPIKYFQKGRYAIFVFSEKHEGILSNGKSIYCTDDYIYIRKAYRL